MALIPRWRLVWSGDNDGATNMAVDEAILMSVSRGESAPTLRFYGWKPPTVSIGYFQSLDKEVDVTRCQSAGYGIVRRPTGGRAVLHDDEVTYSIAVREADFPGTVVETYKTLSAGLVAGLRMLSVDAEVMAHSPQKERSSAACFDAPSWYEVICHGKKVIGSAQVRKMNTILQHGSIPLTFSSDRVVDALLLSSETLRKRLASHLSEKAAGLADFLPSRPDFVQVARCLVKGISESLGVTFVESSLTPWEEQTAAQIRAEKYDLSVWNQKR